MLLSTTKSCRYFLLYPLSQIFNCLHILDQELLLAIDSFIISLFNLFILAITFVFIFVDEMGFEPIKQYFSDCRTP